MGRVLVDVCDVWMIGRREVRGASPEPSGPAGTSRRAGIRGCGRPVPILTITATSLAGVAAVAQYTIAAMVPALQREPGGLRSGQWWRLVTPLLVQTLGWYQVVTNLVTLMLFGVIVEWLLGRWRWALLFAAGTAAGQAAAYAWHEPGGGDSIAICGLAAGAAITMLSRPRATGWMAAAVIYYVVALTGWGLRGLTTAGVGCLAVGIVLTAARGAGLAHVTRLALAGTVVCAVVLASRHDLHGAALSGGMLLTTALLTADATVRRGGLADRGWPVGRLAGRAVHDRGQRNGCPDSPWGSRR